MRFDFSICKPDTIPKESGLHTIFRVWGDHTYHVPKRNASKNNICFLLTTKGSGIIRFDQKTITISKNEFLFLKPVSTLSYECSEDTWEFWWFEFSRMPIKLMYNTIYQTQLSSFLLSMLDHTLLSAKEHQWTLSESLLKSVCLFLEKEYNEQAASKESSLILHIDQYIEAHLHDLRISELCDTFSLKERTFRNLFYRHHHCPPKAFIDQLRIDRAQQLLLNTSLPIYQIADQLGFSSQFHFSRRFHDCTNLTPSEYRLLTDKQF